MKYKTNGSSNSAQVSDVETGIMQRQDGILGKKMINNDYEAVCETMQAGLKPPWALYDTFMREAELMATYKGHGKDHDKEISFLCTKFEEAYADNDIERMVDLYDDLESIRLQPHRRHN